MKKLSGHANIRLEQIIAAHQCNLRGLVGARIPTHLTSVVSVEDVLQTVWMEIDRLVEQELESEHLFLLY